MKDVYDVYGTKLSVGDTVKVVRAGNTFLIGQTGKVVCIECCDKIAVSFNEHWQDYFKTTDIALVRDTKLNSDGAVVKNAEYFRKLQNLKTVDQQVEEDVEHVIATIEKYIREGGKEQSVNFQFYPRTQKHVGKFVQQLKGLGFVVCPIRLLHFNKFECCVVWEG